MTAGIFQYGSLQFLYINTSIAGCAMRTIHTHITGGAHGAPYN
jgi:hypothetical protein